MAIKQETSLESIEQSDLPPDTPEEIKQLFLQLKENFALYSIRDLNLDDHIIALACGFTRVQVHTLLDLLNNLAGSGK